MKPQSLRCLYLAILPILATFLVPVSSTAADGRGENRPATGGELSPGVQRASYFAALGNAAYVALGDSFQSGEGAGDYDPSTNDAANMCRRSRLAYSYEISRATGLTLNFGACSGAKIADLSETNDPTGPPWNDGISQFDRLGTATKLVTIGIGGNDVHFGGILRILAAPTPDRIRADATFKTYLNLIHPPTGPSQLEGVFQTIREKAPEARILVLGYPRMFVPSGATVGGVEPGRCGPFARIDQLWANSANRALNDAMRDAASAVSRIQYVEVYDSFSGYEMCGQGPAAINSLRPELRESFHPNAVGHQLLADTILSAYELGPTEMLVQQGQSKTKEYLVPPSSAAAFWTNWPGSEVSMTLRSPSGRLIDATTVADDVRHGKGATYESYELANPEPGVWSVSLFGTQVSAGGEPTTLSIFTYPSPNSQPLAALKLRQTGRIVDFDATASADPDGSIAEFYWHFGDGTTGAGAVNSHTYPAAGTYSFGLAVTDNSGNTGFVWQTITVAPDTTGPTITWQGTIADGAVFDLGAVPPTPSCTATDELGGSGVTGSGCVVTGYATSIGEHQLTATATDNEGNTTRQTRTYTVRSPSISPTPTAPQPPTPSQSQDPTPSTAPTPGPVPSATATPSTEPPTLPNPSISATKPGSDQCNSCARAAARATSRKSKMTVTVTPRCLTQYRFRVQRRAASRAAGSDEPATGFVWKSLKTTYRTQGRASSRTIDLPKGVYRAVVAGACGNSGTNTNTVTLRR